MLKNKIKNIISAVTLGALMVVSVGSMKSMAMINTTQAVQDTTINENLDNHSYKLNQYYYSDFIREMLNAGYIDQAKADSFMDGVDSKDTQLEIDKTYSLFIVDSLVKSGEYSEERGNLEKQLIEAEYAKNDALYEEIYEKYWNVVEKERLFSNINEMLDAGYIDQSKADSLINSVDFDNTKTEISKTYELFLTDSLIKDGYYSLELGNLEKQLIEAKYAGNDELYGEIYEKYWNLYEKDRLINNINEMLDAGYIDRDKADDFIKSIDSKDIKTEINKIYDLFIVDLFVKEGYYTSEIGELEKQLIEASYSGNDKLYGEVYEKYWDLIMKEGLSIADNLDVDNYLEEDVKI